LADKPAMTKVICAPLRRRHLKRLIMVSAWRARGGSPRLLERD